MEYIALYIRPHKRCQYKKNFNCFWCVLLIWKCLQTCHLPPSRLPFYWTPLFFVILGYFLFCHPRTLFSPVMFGLVSSSVTFGLFLPLSSSGLTRGSLDIRLKAEYDVRKISPAMTEGRFFAPAARFSFLPILFSESKISAPAERKFGICAYGANRFFF